MLGFVPSPLPPWRPTICSPRTAAVTAVMSSITRRIVLAVLVACAAGAHAEEGSRHLAPGFSTRAAQSKLVVVPADMELFSISAGGIQEPRADWTESAQKNFKAA